MVSLSVVIATHNRANSLAGCLMALADLDFPDDELEVIVADNGSTDNTRFIAENFKKLIQNCRYIYDPRPGQVVGWHQALRLAEADIVAFIDDDVRPVPSWATTAIDIFSEPDVGLGTGKILPEFEERPPAWQNKMILPHAEGSWSALWGMLDFGESRKEIPVDFVWGSNFLARKSALIEAGGFHPGGMPTHLFHFTGDGDVAAGRQMAARGYRAVYDPGASVAHHLPASRNGAAEVQRWIYGEGLVTSYVALREASRRHPDVALSALTETATSLLGTDRISAIGHGYLGQGSALPSDIEQVMMTAGGSGYEAHQRYFELDPIFRDWVLQPDYLDIDRCYVHPELLPE